MSTHFSKENSTSSDKVIAWGHLQHYSQCELFPHKWLTGALLMMQVICILWFMPIYGVSFSCFIHVHLYASDSHKICQTQCKTEMRVTDLELESISPSVDPSHQHWPSQRVKLKELQPLLWDVIDTWISGELEDSARKYMTFLSLEPWFLEDWGESVTATFRLPGTPEVGNG